MIIKIMWTVSIIFIIIVIIILLPETPYSIGEFENDIMKDYDEKRWIEYQKTDEFKKDELN